MEKIIELAVDDDIVSIKSRLEWAKDSRILMVVPKKNQTLQSLVNLKLLARAADDLNLTLALATPHSNTRDLAKEVGLPTFPNERTARRKRYISREAEKTTAQTTAAPVIQDTAIPAPPRVRVKNRKLVLVIGKGRVSLWQQILAFFLIGITGLALVMAVLAVAPQATLTLIPQVDVISTELTIRADPSPEITSIDRENGIIPARPLQVELTLFDEVATLETDAAPVDFATGSVVFFNRTQNEQLIPISTILRTSSGVPVEFETRSDVTIPPGIGATATVSIIAKEPGPTGNVSSGQINRFAKPSLSLLVRVINESGTGGGSVRQAGVVVEDDKDRLRSKLRQLVQQKGFELLQAELDEQEFISPESLQVIDLDLTYNRFSGDISETLGGEMRAVVRATAVGSFNTNQLAYGQLLDQVPPGQRLLTKGLQFTAGGVEQVDNRAVVFPVTAQGLVVSELDIDYIREAVTFMPIGEAQNWLSQNQAIISVPGVEVFPNWLGRLPLFPFRVDVQQVDVVPLIFGE